jgi:uncharacterized protein (TIGR03083 family)
MAAVPDPAADRLVIDQLEEVWSSTVGACQGLGPEDWERPTDCPGWSVRDQLSHTIGIERSLLGEPPPAFEGDQPAYVRNPIGEMNEAWVAERRSRPGAQVLEEFEAVTGRRLAELRALPPARFDVVGWSPIGQVPYREFMGVRVFDSWVHEQDIRHALGRSGGRGRSGEEATLRRVAETMPYVVGKKVAPPDGSSIVFEVTGPLGRTVTVSMAGGRATLAPEAPGCPAVRLVLDAEVFWMLGCGRVAPQQVLEDRAVAFEGDGDLGRRVVEAMPFTI